MPRIEIKATIINSEETKELKTKAILQDEIIKYKEDDTLVSIDLERHILTRDNNNYKLLYNFDENKGSINLKENNQIVEIPIITKNIERKNNDIKIEYAVENDIFKYQVEEEKWVY